MAAGFPVGGSAVVISLNDFVPPDDKTKHFYSVELGYLGGAVRAKIAAGDQFVQLKTGDQVDFRGRVVGGKKGLEIQLDQVGPQGSLKRAA